MEEKLRRRLSGLLTGAGVPGGKKRRPPSPGAALPPGREVRTPFGSYYLVERSLAGAWRIARAGDVPLFRGPWRLREGSGEGIAVARPLFFDLETTGLTAAPLFLSATIDLEGGTVRQRFARHYGEERAVVAATIDEIAPATVVTYNGKSYDLPYLRNRAAYHRLPFRPAAEHVDLLHVCRRAWKGRFPDFRLTTIERIFASAERIGDIPGAEIPALYHGFVRRGHDPRMPGVFLHNLRDVVTLVRIFLLLARKEGERSIGS